MAGNGEGQLEEARERTGIARPARTAAPLDPELAACLRRAPALLSSIGREHIGMLRAGAARLGPSDAVLAGDGRRTIDIRRVPVAGGEIEALLLRPAHATAPLPGIVFLHGGGMIAGDARSGLDAVLDWVDTLGIGLVSVDYRLAPEHPHPVPVEDCLAALRWIDAGRAGLGLDDAPLLLAGASAGGGLAAGAALLARERGGPALAGLMLMAPMLDDAERFASSVAYDGDVPWDRASNRTGWSALLGAAVGGPDVPDCAAPIRAHDLSGLPPTFLDVGGVETFRDETIAFAARLAQADVPIELHVWAGAFHGFDVIARDSALAATARATRLAWLRRRLAERGGR
ncbi:alpha/beta hydrolase fold domain-containing protein [Sphingomonas profundi]|uniref:alpha/beta hydrolase fold domain-containing protein n=1 Tax=Alterirhizorhabdus profundi TaxID=2681549 RepID=UPI0018D136A2|nr:alpha/beta hydrolase fold domain-containing protein [Sphingomonas profundi]